MDFSYSGILVFTKINLRGLSELCVLKPAIMQFHSQTLLNDLQADTRAIILEADQWRHLPIARLQAQPGPDRWSVAQVIEHLNVYCRHYIPAMELKLRDHRTKASLHFSPGWLGGYFTRLMQPGENGTVARKLSAPGNARPPAQLDAVAVLREFLDWQQRLLTTLEKAATASLSQLRVPTSLSSLIALTLGDTLRFFIAHQQRHMLQGRRALEGR
jgi:uncharacterized damage-inducible protein DinB